MLWSTGLTWAPMGFCSRQSTGSGVVVPGPRDCNVWALDCTGFCSRGTWAELPQGLWGLPGPGIKPVSPALTGGLLTTDPPGKPSCVLSDDWRLLAGVCANKRGTLPVGSREPAHLQPAPGEGCTCQALGAGDLGGCGCVREGGPPCLGGSLLVAGWGGGQES